jgi:uncharacterized protein YutE (UPF0331/DUF86 family)
LHLLSDTQRKALLEKLIRMNAIRNKIVHGGYRASSTEAMNAIKITGIMLRALWVTERINIFKKQGLNHLFDSSKKKIAKLSI